MADDRTSTLATETAASEVGRRLGFWRTYCIQRLTWWAKHLKKISFG